MKRARQAVKPAKAEREAYAATFNGRAMLHQLVEEFGRPVPDSGLLSESGFVNEGKWLSFAEVSNAETLALRAFDAGYDAGHRQGVKAARQP